jgi:hypothetical protein
MACISAAVTRYIAQLLHTFIAFIALIAFTQCARAWWRASDDSGLPIFKTYERDARDKR